ncbi:hypothetical protein ACFL46_01440 [Candidatus Neomarinimicrobiota bacterium]
MNTKTTNKLYRLPFYLIGITLIILGPIWIFMDEPWMFDQVANEAALGTSFEELLNAEINHSLPDYLRIIYTWFGLWVTSLGVMIVLNIHFLDINNHKAKNIFSFVTGLFLLVSVFLGYTTIPESPFIFVIWVLIIVYLAGMFTTFRKTTM